MKKIGILLIALNLLAGCLLVLPDVQEQAKAPAGAKSRALGPFDNNSVVRLEPGRYQGNFEIRANKVTLIGSGTDNTLIVGGITILGNNCTIRALTISGDVLLAGNNNNLSAAVVQGRVIAKGNNNIW